MFLCARCRSQVFVCRPFAMVDFYGTPYTQALHVVERYRLLDYEGAKEGLERDLRKNLRPATGAALRANDRETSES